MPQLPTRSFTAAERSFVQQSVSVKGFKPGAVFLPGFRAFYEWNICRRL